MAKDVITRFKLETTDYDSKLRDTAKSLADLTSHLTLAGKDFDTFAAKNVEAARSLGNIAPSATNVKDKLKELVSALNSVAKSYNNLTKEQQQSDFGKAMADSLSNLKAQIKDAKEEMYSSGGVLDKLAQKFTVNVDAIKLFNLGMKGAEAALKVAKDAFFASEANLDKWEGAVYAAESAYQAFLTSLNTGDVSGFLANIDTIVKAATDAFNAIDRLGTLQIIQSPQVAKKQTEIERFQTMLRTGRYVAPLDGRSTNGMKTGDKLSQAQMDRIANYLASAIKEIAGLAKNEVAATTDVINSLYEEQAVRLQMSNKQFREGTATMQEFEKNLELSQKYWDFEAEHSTLQKTKMVNGAPVYESVRDNAINPYTEYKNWKIFKEDGDLYNRIVQYIQQRANAESQYYGLVGRSYRGINKVEGGNVGGGSSAKAASATTKLTEEEKEAARQAKALAEAEKKRAEQLNKLREEAVNAVRNNDLKSAFAVQKKAQEGGYRGDTSIPLTFTYTQDNMSALMSELKTQIGQSEIGGDMYNALTEQLKDATSLSSLIDYALKSGIDAADLQEVAQSLWQKLLGEGDIPDEAFKEVFKNFSTKNINANEDGDPSKLWKEVGEVASETSKITSGVSQIVGGLQNLGVTIPEGLSKVISSVQAVTSILSGISSIALAILAISSVKATPVVGWALAGGGIVPKAAGGRLIPGNSYSGDNIFAGNAWVNSGELVLNKSEQASLASMMRDAQTPSMAGTPYVNGETLFLGINNYLRGRGMGELATVQNG